MARPGTTIRVHRAVLELAAERGPSALTMEGIAARAEVGKQTLYRSWSGVPDIIFDALLELSAQPTHDEAPSAGDHATTIERLLRGAVEEISTEPHASLLRALAAAIQTDESVARAYESRLLRPRLTQVHELLRAGGTNDPERAAELLLAPVFYRWFMRLTPMSEVELSRHVRQVLEITDDRG